VSAQVRGLRRPASPQRLETAARVAGVGCGSGITLLTLAETFPRSQSDGCDPSRHAIERARDNLTGRGWAMLPSISKQPGNCPPARRQ
jgi:methylase of polypeptide subunit release factors